MEEDLVSIVSVTDYGSYHRDGDMEGAFDLDDIDLDDLDLDSGINLDTLSDEQLHAKILNNLNFGVSNSSSGNSVSSASSSSAPGTPAFGADGGAAPSNEASTNGV